MDQARRKEFTISKSPRCFLMKNYYHLAGVDHFYILIHHRPHRHILIAQPLFGF